MANRDVKMIISATDKASQATNAVRNALQALQTAQDSAADSASRNSSAIGQFGAALGKLQQSLRGNNVGDQLQAQFERARAATKRLETQLEETTQSQVDYARRSKESATAVKQERQAVIALEASLSKERETRNALRAELNRANRPVARAQASGGTATQEQLAAVRRAEDAFTKQAAAVQKLEVNLATARGRVTDLVREENRLSAAADKAEVSIDSLNQDLVSSRVEMIRLGREAGRTEDALQELGRSATVSLQQAVAAQRQATSTAGIDFSSAQARVGPAEQEFLAAQRAADDYQVTLGETAQETRELRAESDRLEKAFNDQRGLAEALRQEYLEQQQTLGRLAAISREAAGDVNEIADRQARFTAEQQRGAQATQRIQASVERYQASLGRASARTQRLAAEEKRLAAASARAAGTTLTLAGALRQFFGEGKRALSITQRLRGQVLSLATQYVGFFAVFQGVGAVVGAVQQLEGATNSLAAVFDGDFEAVGGELDFLRRNADRLGIGFGQLSEDYTKFAAATKNTPIQDETRQIFIRVAEAGRVLNLTADQMSGTLTALSQIASKGVVSMEELRQQLGDRLPGALQIMADGLNVTTGELIKLIESGELSSTALVGFAGELENRFGPQLAGSLTSLNAELGRFTNGLFEAQIAFANGGFLEAFTSLVRTATETLQSADFQAFLQSLGSAFQLAFGIAETAIKNFQLVFTGLVAFASAKAAPVIIATAGSLLAFARNALVVARNTLVLQKNVVGATTATSTMGRAAQTAALRVGLMGRALKATFASTGIGLLIIGVSTAMAALSTQANKTEEALNKQQKTVDALRNAHDSGAVSAKDYSDALNTITAAEARQNLTALRKEAANLESQLDNLLTGRGVSGQGSGLAQLFDGVEGINIGNLFGANRFGAQFTREFAEEIKQLSVALEGGAISAREFELASQRLAESQDFTEAENNKFVAAIDLIEQNIEARRNLGTAVQLNEVKQKELRGELDLTEIATIAAANATDELGASLRDAVPELVGLQETINEISKGVPALAKELKKTEELEALGTTLEAAGLSADIEVLTQQVAQFNRVAALTANIPGIGRAAAENAEKFNELLAVTKARLDAINNPPTRTSRQARDPFKEAREALQESIASDDLQLQVDALRRQGNELQAIAVERAAAFQDIVEGLTGTQQQRLVEEFGVTFEQLGQRIFEATRSENAKEGLEEIMAAVSEAQIALDEASRGDNTSDARTTNFAAQLARDIAEMQAEIDRLDLTPLEAQQAEEGIARVRALRTATFELEEAERRFADQQQRATEATGLVNTLLQTRRDLIQQIQAAEAAGNDSGAEALREQVSALDTELVSARGNAEKLLEALAATGNPEAIAALQAFRAQFVVVEEIIQGTEVTLREVADTISNNLGQAVSGFAEALAAGEPVLASLGRAVQSFVSDTLIQLGQAIAQAVIFQAVLGAFGLGGGGNGGSIVQGLVRTGVAHEGKTGGRNTNRSRTVPASTFAGAPKFHEGRSGLATGEMAAIIKTNEDVLTRDNPFHSANLSNTVRGLQGGGGGGTGDVKIVNMMDAAGMLEAALQDTPGQRVLVNHIRREAESINAALDR